MKSKKSIKFTLAHAIAKKTVHSVGDYLIAFSLALRDINSKKIAMKRIKEATHQPSFNRLDDTFWSVCQLACGACVIVASRYKKGCTDFIPSNREVVSIQRVVKGMKIPSFANSAEKFIFNYASKNI